MRLLALLLLAVPAALGAQERAATAAPRTRLALTADRLIVGDGSVIPQPVILVEGDRIVAVGPAAQVRIPAGVRTIALPGHTLLPGLMDCHTHITAGDNDGGDLAVLRETAAHAGIYGVANARRTLEAGFTTIRDVGSLYYAEIALRDMIARGVVPGPRIHGSGPALGVIGGHADVNGWSPTLQVGATGVMVTGADETRRAVRTNVKYGADHIKIVATGGILSVGDAATASQFDSAEVTAAIEEATRLGRKVAAHAHGPDGLKQAVRAGAASIEHGSLIDDEGIALMKARGAFIVPTLLILDEIVKHGAERGVPPYAIAKGRLVEPERRRRLRAAWQGGVRFAFGTDAVADLHGRNAEEFVLMQEQLGMTPMETIRSATQWAAELIGVSEQLGTITAGKLADIIAVAGDPLTDLRRMTQVGFVMKGGEVVKAPAR